MLFVRSIRTTPRAMRIWSASDGPRRYVISFDERNRKLGYRASVINGADAQRLPPRDSLEDARAAIAAFRERHEC